MKCTNCDGRGAVQIAPNVKGLKRCPVCDGSGEVSQILQTNEQWFCRLSTKEKAKWLYDHYVNARADEYYGRQEKTLSEYQKWLVSVHREIDGTKID